MATELKEASPSPAGIMLGKIARLFPGATQVRIPVSVYGASPRIIDLAENTVIEFGTANAVFFNSGLPIEINDLLEVENADGSLSADAVVMAVQHCEGNRAVAAKFLWPVENWIIKP